MIDLKHRYQILETDLGPMISESRSSVFDVMEMEDKGYNVAEIAMIFNLTSLHVQSNTPSFAAGMWTCLTSRF